MYIDTYSVHTSCMYCIVLTYMKLRRCQVVGVWLLAFALRVARPHTHIHTHTPTGRKRIAAHNLYISTETGLLKSHSTEKAKKKKKKKKKHPQKKHPLRILSQRCFFFKTILVRMRKCIHNQCDPVSQLPNRPEPSLTYSPCSISAHTYVILLRPYARQRCRSWNDTTSARKNKKKERKKSLLACLRYGVVVSGPGRCACLIFLLS